jgi:Flp pilus assembly protein protease CpaA
MHTNRFVLALVVVSAPFAPAAANVIAGLQLQNHNETLLLDA